ncbi:hypothetical protein FJZ53_04300 [Candidatus Woesearchaeota archaeon]|nr:hypothetical protein [Candidatus Woesearchaeota archaeon]
MAKSFPYIEAKGSNYQIGCAIGEHLKEKMRDYDARMKLLYSKLVKDSHHDLNVMAEKTEALILKYFPQYLKELQGMADGSDLSLHEILLLCSEETLIETVKKGCTTFAYPCIEGIFLGHNEDWLLGYEDNMYIVKAKPKKGPAFLSLAYIGTLPGSSVALNSCGIAFSGNSLLSGAQDGMPKNIILRSQIEAKNLEEFVDLASFSPRAIPNHTMAIDKNGKIVSVELALDRHCIVYTPRYFVHTNHALHPNLAMLEQGPVKNSAARYQTSLRHLLEKELNRDLAKRILRSHEHSPDSVCVHSKTDRVFPEDGHTSQTIASAVVNIKNMTMSVAWGNPCKSKFKTYRLEF